jgi:hypothetical protein
MDSESKVESTPIPIIQEDPNMAFCFQHNKSICCFCIHKECRKALCYECVYDGIHKNHIEECIPMNMWRIENADGEYPPEVLEKMEEAKAQIKEIQDYVVGYFTKKLQNLNTLKDETQENKVDLPEIIKNSLDLFKIPKQKDGTYKIDSAEFQLMINGLYSSLAESMYSDLQVKLMKLRLQNRYFSTIKKTVNRFSGAKDGWDNSTGKWDALGFKVADDSIILSGFGVYKPENTSSDFKIKVKIFEEDLDDIKVVYEEEFEISKLKYEGEFADVRFEFDFPLIKDRTYIISKFNEKQNSNSRHGKEQNLEISTEPFELISYIDKSNSYKSGNSTDLNSGAFPYFLYRKQI